LWQSTTLLEGSLMLARSLLLKRNSVSLLMRTLPLMRCC
jgi:hypothetical protein